MADTRIVRLVNLHKAAAETFAGARGEPTACYLQASSKRRSKCKIKSAPLLEALCLLLPLSIERANYLLK